MARLARVVVPGLPHHVTQRGNRRQTTFFSDADYAAYLEILAEALTRARVALSSYCLMPNHVHLILVPETESGLAAALAEAHRRYTRQVNLREGWRGYLWQGRFSSFPLDGAHLLAAARYVELNPVRARLAARPEDWPWSSARAHLGMIEPGGETAADRILSGDLPEAVGDWRSFLAGGMEAETAEAIRRHERTGRPLGSGGFLKELERRLGRALAKRRPGPKPKGATEEA
ncbi:transposase [Nisaea acidiphila]|uniref:Transposase n=1 Tax=Nisaea acidiphila TaxID=1862145 RepID=A0A9J7AYS0_9PROT|nr:transposase [Nisaea acidiphila]UUX51412.1 transposase [Nisaea acidiphila]